MDMIMRKTYLLSALCLFLAFIPFTPIHAQEGFAPGLKVGISHDAMGGIFHWPNTSMTFWTAGTGYTCGGVFHYGFSDRLSIELSPAFHYSRLGESPISSDPSAQYLGFYNTELPVLFKVRSKKWGNAFRLGGFIGQSLDWRIHVRYHGTNDPGDGSPNISDHFYRFGFSPFIGIEPQFESNIGIFRPALSIRVTPTNYFLRDYEATDENGITTRPYDGATSFGASFRFTLSYLFPSGKG